MTELLHREIIYLWYYFSVQLEQIAGYWVLGMLIGSAVSVFAKDHIHNLFRSLQDKKLGIASPLCMYGTIPIAASFSKSGMKDDWLAAFMMSSILLNPQLILYSAALGMPALIIRILSCFFCGAAAGLLIHFLYERKPFFEFQGFSEPENRDTDPSPLLRYIKMSEEMSGQPACISSSVLLCQLCSSVMFRQKP